MIEAIVEMGSEEAPLLLPAPVVEGCPGCAMELQASIHINYCLISINALALHLAGAMPCTSDVLMSLRGNRIQSSDNAFNSSSGLHCANSDCCWIVPSSVVRECLHYALVASAAAACSPAMSVVGDMLSACR